MDIPQVLILLEDLRKNSKTIDAECYSKLKKGPTAYNRRKAFETLQKMANETSHFAITTFKEHTILLYNPEFRSEYNCLASALDELDIYYRSVI